MRYNLHKKNQREQKVFRKESEKLHVQHVLKRFRNSLKRWVFENRLK